MKAPRSVKIPPALQTIKKGRITLGGFYELSGSRRIFLAYQWRKDIHREKQPSVSAAAAEGVAGWAIDTETLRRVRREGCIAVGVFVRDSGDIYLTGIENYFDNTIYTEIDWSRRSRHAQRSVPLQLFSRKIQPAKVR